MKTAEEIIQEYRDRGYSLESLRILAESREEPLGGRMLDVIARLEAAEPAAREESGMADVPCETGTYSRVDGDMVFFVADDEAPVDGGSVDFDLMAATAESVADIVIGETDGADVVSYRTEAVDAAESEAAESEAAESEAALPEVPSEGGAEPGVWSRLWSRVAQLPAPDPAPSMAEEREAAAAMEMAPSAEEEAADERPVFGLEPVGANAEASADYMPGSVMLPVEPPEAVAELPEERPEEPAAAKTESRREKRRRERQEKKKARRAKERAEDALPEIVLTRAEGTETLVPEADAAGPSAEERALGVLTPLDIIAPAAEERAEVRGIDPEAPAALSAHAFSLVASLAAMSREELAKAAEIIGQDRAEAPAAERNNAEAAPENLEEEAAEGENNVILFRGNFPAFAEDSGGEDAEEEEARFEPFLRLLSAPETEEFVEPEAGFTLAVNACEVAEEAVEQLLQPESAPEAEVEPEPETDPLEALLERETALRLRLEEDCRTRLDEFAVRLLEAQALTAASENRVAEKKAELDARSAVLEEMKNRLASEEEKQRELLRRLDEADAAMRTKDGEIADLNGLRDEHNRLYAEFEDLRKAYNEVVTDVMPGLQNERDDLAMTVERLCSKEHTLKTGLRSARKRLAAGYILGAAACLMLVTLPVANWLRSGEEDRQLAVDHQLFSELRGTLDTQVQQNVDAQTRIVELERKITRARDEITRLDGRNRELAGLAAGQHSQGIAVFKPEDGSGAGTPTRAMTMALQATVPPGGRLHVNEVMDPAGSIEQLAMDNRARNAAPYQADDRMARAPQNSGAALPVSALVRADPASGSLRPQARAAAAPRRESALRPSAAADGEIVTAKVKKGEGVAQVVYRVLNTRDPEVIAWVIEENRIRSDRRGNPVIQPNQELRLPRDGRTGQAASAVRAPRR